MAGPELYNSKIISTYLKLIKGKYSYVDIAELLTFAGMEQYQVEDQAHWFTQEQIDRFYEKARQLTGNDNLAREAGRYSLSYDAVGVIRQHLLGLVSLSEAYMLVNKLVMNFTRSAQYISRSVGTNKVEITVTPYAGVEERPFQCENRMGYLEAIGLCFAHQLPHVVHTECIFKGGAMCRYEISWRDIRSVFWKKARNYAAAILVPVCIASLFYMSVGSAFIGFAVSIILVLLLDMFASLLERDNLHSAFRNVRSSAEELIDRINANYNNALLINEIGLALSKKIDLNDVFNSIAEIFSKRVDYDRGLILLSDKDKTILRYSAGFGYIDEQVDMLKNTTFHLNRPESKGPFVVAFSEQKPILVNNIEDIAPHLSEKSLAFAKKLGSKSFIVCPIMYEGESFGILAVDNVNNKRSFLQSDINLLMGIAPEIGISIHNARLIESREEQFKSTLEVLAKSIDARDFLTAGHSEKVTEYAGGN